MNHLSPTLGMPSYRATSASDHTLIASLRAMGMWVAYAQCARYGERDEILPGSTPHLVGAFARRSAAIAALSNTSAEDMRAAVAPPMIPHALRPELGDPYVRFVNGYNDACADWIVALQQPVAKRPGGVETIQRNDDAFYFDGYKRACDYRVVASPPAATSRFTPDEAWATYLTFIKTDAGLAIECHADREAELEHPEAELREAFLAVTAYQHAIIHPGDGAPNPSLARRQLRRLGVWPMLTDRAPRGVAPGDGGAWIAYHWRGMVLATLPSVRMATAAPVSYHGLAEGMLLTQPAPQRPAGDHYYVAGPHPGDEVAAVIDPATRWQR